MLPGLNVKHLLILAATLLGLSGCVAYPADPFYSYGSGYYGGYDPYYYYGPPAVSGTVIFGGGPHYYHHHHWR